MQSAWTATSPNLPEAARRSADGQASRRANNFVPVDEALELSRLRCSHRWRDTPLALVSGIVRRSATRSTYVTSPPLGVPKDTASGPLVHTQRKLRRFIKAPNAKPDRRPGPTASADHRRRRNKRDILRRH